MVLDVWYLIQSLRLTVPNPVKSRAVNEIHGWLSLLQEAQTERNSGKGVGKDGLAKREFAFSSSLLMCSWLLVIHLL